MKFYAKDAFTKLDPTTGTIQNNSLIYDVEVSDKAEVGSGILLHARNKYTFFNQVLYVRCCAKGGWAEVNVVPFLVDSGGIFSGGGSSGVVDDPEHFTDDDLDDIFKP